MKISHIYINDLIKETSSEVSLNDVPGIVGDMSHEEWENDYNHNIDKLNKDLNGEFDFSHEPKFPIQEFYK